MTFLEKMISNGVMVFFALRGKMKHVKNNRVQENEKMIHVRRREISCICPREIFISMMRTV